MAIVAVMVEPLSPKLTPLAFEKTTESMFPLVVPAEKFKDAAPAAATERDIELLPNVAEMFVKFKPADVFTNRLPASDSIAVVRYAP